jgi:MFS transporter, ACS family, allantoate permease
MTMDDKHIVDVEADGHRSPSPVEVEKRQSLPNANKAAQKVFEHSHDADEAMKAFESGEIIEIDEATNKRLLRTIDLHLLPLMCVVYGLNYLDKTTLSYASIMGLQKDIHLVGDNYQWLG